MHKVLLSPNPIDGQLIAKHLEKSRCLDQLITHTHCFYHTFNHYTSKFEFLSRGLLAITGYTKDEYISMGNFPLLEIGHPDDVAILESALFRDFKEVFSKYSIEDRSRLKFQFNYRILRKDKSVINILEQDNFVEIDINGNAQLSFGSCSQIPFNDGPYYCGLSVYFLSEKTSQIVFQRIYRPGINIHENNLTSREREVIKLLVDGMTSKEIGEQLHISKNTVDNHRRNLLRKLKVKRTNELVRMVVQNEWE